MKEHPLVAGLGTIPPSLCKHLSAAVVFLSCMLQVGFCPCCGKEHGFILVHLNIHDSLHFCSKRHLFI
uniref:Uncharacterized protein n=1 Tax=Phasianus colchicus TaxID=9054 RepID=A0A669PWE8_PHACC